MKRSLSLGCILFLVILVPFGGCSKEPEEPLRIGSIPWPGYQPLFLASSLSLNGNVPIQLVEFSSSSEVIRSLRNGAIEAAALTLDETLTLAQYDKDLSIVLVMDISQGADVVLGKSSLKQMSDLKGKRVGVESTALGAYMLTRALEISKLNVQDIRVVSLVVSEHERALLEGRVDAVVTFEPVKTRLLSKGATELFNSRQIPGEIIDVLVVHKKYLNRHPQVVEGTLRGWFKALQRIKTDPMDSAQRVAGRLRVTPEEFLASLSGIHLPDYDENKRLLHENGDDHSLANTLKRMKRIMLERKLIATDIPEGALIDSKPLLNAVP